MFRRAPAGVAAQWKAAKRLRRAASEIEAALWRRDGYSGERLRRFPRDLMSDELLDQVRALIRDLEDTADKVEKGCC